MVSFSTDGMETRVLEYIIDNYPVTVGDIAKGLHVQIEKVELAIRKLLQMGLVDLDVLPDKVYVRALAIPDRGGGRRKGFRYPGRKEKERRKKEKKEEEARDYSYM